MTFVWLKPVQIRLAVASLAESAFSGWDACFARINRPSHAQGTRQPLENGFRNMVAVFAINQAGVEVHFALNTDGMPEFFDKFGIKVADFGGWKRNIPDEVRSSREIDSDLGQCFVHGKGHVSVSIEAFFIAQGTVNGLAQADSDIFGGVVAVDMNIAIAVNMEVDEAVLGEKGQHVIQKAEAGCDVGFARAIEIDGEFDFGFGCVALDLMGSRHGFEKWILKRLLE